MKKIELLQKMSLSEAKTYLTGIVGAEKAELLFEEQSCLTAVGDVQVGSFVKYGGIEWVVLDQNKQSKATLLLSKKCLLRREFDGEGCNNWAKSSLRKALQSVESGRLFVLSELAGINADDLVPMERNLLTDDGMPDYGTCTDLVSIYTAEEYRKYRKYIPNCEQWHWTITADSLVCSDLARCVNSRGSMDYDDVWGGGGVRPLCNLKSEISVEVLSE